MEQHLKRKWPASAKNHEIHNGSRPLTCVSYARDFMASRWRMAYGSIRRTTADMDNSEIYKMELDGKILGKFGTAGKQLKEFGSVHAIDCRSRNEIYVGELTNWRVQKLTLHPEQAK
jgi:hypothetical protein